MSVSGRNSYQTRPTAINPNACAPSCRRRSPQAQHEAVSGRRSATPCNGSSGAQPYSAIFSMGLRGIEWMNLGSEVRRKLCIFLAIADYGRFCDLASAMDGRTSKTKAATVGCILPSAGVGGLIPHDCTHSRATALLSASPQRADPNKRGHGAIKAAQ